MRYHTNENTVHCTQFQAIVHGRAWQPDESVAILDATHYRIEKFINVQINVWLGMQSHIQFDKSFTCVLLFK